MEIYKWKIQIPHSLTLLICLLYIQVYATSFFYFLYNYVFSLLCKNEFILYTHLINMFPHNIFTLPHSS